MNELGLGYESLKNKLNEKGISDNSLIEAIADVIYENNIEIEKNLLKIIDEQLKAEIGIRRF